MPQASPFDSEVASFDNRVVAAGAPAIDPRMVANALDAVYGSAAVARLEKLPDEGWTREILQTHILRRAEDILPEFSANLAGDAPTRDRTLTQLFDRAALEALPSALTEQEAVAFSASLKRYLQGRAAAGEPAAADAVRVVPISDPNASASAIADAEAMFEKIDAQFPSPELGLRGKLRARRIVLDCLTEADPTRKNVALVASPAVLIDTRPDCVERVRGELSAPGQMTPAPADSIWTQQGPMFHGQKWEIASGRS